MSDGVISMAMSALAVVDSTQKFKRGAFRALMDS